MRRLIENISSADKGHAQALLWWGHKCIAREMLLVEATGRDSMLFSFQIIAELQTTISSLKEENCRQQLAAERRLQDAVQKFEDEKKQLIRDNDRAIKVI